jgi:hypothetical protein
LVYRAEIRLSQGKLKAAARDLRRALSLGAPSDPFVDRAKKLARRASDLGGRRRR